MVVEESAGYRARPYFCCGAWGTNNRFHRQARNFFLFFYKIFFQRVLRGEDNASFVFVRPCGAFYSDET